MGGTDPNDMAAKAAGGDDDDILKPLEPGKDIITCSLVTQLEPIDGSKPLKFEVGSRVGAPASEDGEGGEGGESGESAGGASKGAVVAVLVIFLLLVVVGGVLGYRAKANQVPRTKLQNPSYQEAGAIQMSAIDNANENTNA